MVLSALTAQTPIDPCLLNTSEEGADERLETTHNVVLNALIAQIPAPPVDPPPSTKKPMSSATTHNVVFERTHCSDSGRNLVTRQHRGRSQ
mgnify:CR=1 FL=1